MYIHTDLAVKSRLWSIWRTDLDSGFIFLATLGILHDSGNKEDSHPPSYLSITTGKKF